MISGFQVFRGVRGVGFREIFRGLMGGNHIEKNIENDAETGFIWGVKEGFSYPENPKPWELT